MRAKLRVPICWGLNFVTPSAWTAHGALLVLKIPSMFALVLTTSSGALYATRHPSLRACVLPVQRTRHTLLVETPDEPEYDWDAAWRRVQTNGQRLIKPELADDARPSGTPVLLDDAVETRSKASAVFRDEGGIPPNSGQPTVLRRTLARVVDVRQWRLPFFFFTFLRKTDLFGTILATTSFAWVIFYLVVVPATYSLGPAFGMQDVSAFSWQTIAGAIFIPAWPGCLLIAAALFVFRQQYSADD